ncbi:MAG: extracellular solute-binding protein [Candidatus Krumholzibacteriota bacterium]|nr:extracellular solute-binding protein [Candidatus Krumholzibacteriota bacterium]
MINVISGKSREKKGVIFPPFAVGKAIFRGILLFSLILIISSCTRTGGTKEKKLTIFHAGSLSVPFKRIAEAYQAEHPGVKILIESAGSRVCARKISDLGRRCDIMASADYTVIDDLLIPDHATWSIKFASNEMVIAFHEDSKRSVEIDSENWLDILLDPDVAYGRSDPDSDPCGYRTVLTVRLAEAFYGREGFARDLLAKDQRYIRPKEVDLLALLEASAIDYLFIYRSVASQHGLKYLMLPFEINLREAALAEHYKTVSVEITGKEPGSSITKYGAPMIYGVTIPLNAPETDLAITFLEFLLDPEKGLAIMEECGQPSVVPSPAETYRFIPDRLKRFATEPGT